MLKKTHNLQLYLWLSLYIIITILLSFYGSRHSTITICLYILYVALPFYYLKKIAFKPNTFLILFIGGLVCRLIIFGSIPYFSDDVYRFIWDGYIWQLGISPFEYTPEEILNNPKLCTESLKQLYPFLNSKNYFSVYPPLYQYIFRASTYFFQDSIWGNILFMRSILLIAELGVFYLLLKIKTGFFSLFPVHQQTKKMPIQIMYFWLNGLIIVESVGNIHIEVIIGLLLVSSIYILKNHSQVGVFLGVFMSAGFLLKLKPLIYSMVLFKRQKLSQIALGVCIFIACALPILLFEDFLAMFHALKVSSSLFISTFEFNASIYFIFSKWLGYLWGYNPIHTLGPWIFKINTGCIFLFSVYCWYKNKNIVESLILVLAIYLILSTTIHPWYIIPMAVIAPLSKYLLPYVWSVVIVLSYLGYKEFLPYEHPYFFIVLEYFFVFLAIIYDLFMSKESINQRFMVFNK